MNFKLQERCAGSCELCNANPATIDYTVSPRSDDNISNQVAICYICLEHLSNESTSDHWRCLEASIWSQEPSVQALCHRILTICQDQVWAQEVLNSVDLEESIITWALSALEKPNVHKDAYGNLLEQGDTVVLTQVLNVKGTNFMAAKGTIVKKIKLVSDNVEQIEGKINDQNIIILTKFVKKG